MNTRITSSFGALRTLSENLQTSGNTTTVIGFINCQAEIRQRPFVTILCLYAQNSATIHGHLIATDFFEPRLLHEQEFAKDTIYRSLFVQARGVLKKELQLYERTHRAIRRSRHASLKRAGTDQTIKKLPDELYKSLTWDRGKELADHQRFTLETDIDVYFCEPRSPWLRGSNENTNPLLRQYLPQGTDISLHSQVRLNATEVSLLRRRPNQTLSQETAPFQ